jgi:O-antigen/teichoic acid export membrane protein
MLTKPESVPSLRNRILRAGTWTLGGYGTSQAIRLASNLIMTRLLVPEVFGVMAIAIVVQVGVSMMSDVGLRQAVIQNPRGAEPQFLDTIWIAQIVRGFIVAGIAAVTGLLILHLNTAGWIGGSNVYADPILPFVIAAVGATAIVNGFESTNMATASRTLTLGPMTLIELASQIGGICAMIGFALYERSVWALVFGGWVGAVIRVALSHLVLPGRLNHFRWHAESWSQIHGFGRWIFLSSVLGFLASNLDRMMVAGYLPAEEFALFTIAALLVGSARDVISRLYSRICYPAVSEVLRERPEELRNVYYKFRMPMDAISLLACGFLLSGGGAVVELLYDERYNGAGSILELLAISLFMLRYVGIGTCYLAAGKPHVLTIMILARVAGTVILIPSAHYLGGTPAVLLAIPLSHFVTLPFEIYFGQQLKLLDMRQELIPLPALPLGLGLGYVLNGLIASYT